MTQTERNEKLGQLIEQIAKELPEGYLIEIGVERGSGWAHMIDRDGHRRDCGDTDFGLLESLEHYLEQAKIEG